MKEVSVEICGAKVSDRYGTLRATRAVQADKPATLLRVIPDMLCFELLLNNLSVWSARWTKGGKGLIWQYHHQSHSGPRADEGLHHFHFCAASYLFSSLYDS